MTPANKLKQAQSHLSIALTHLRLAQNGLLSAGNKGKAANVRRAIRARDLIGTALDKASAGRDVLAGNS